MGHSKVFAAVPHRWIGPLIGDHSGPGQNKATSVDRPGRRAVHDVSGRLPRAPPSCRPVPLGAMSEGSSEPERSRRLLRIGRGGHRGGGPCRRTVQAACPEGDAARGAGRARRFRRAVRPARRLPRTAAGVVDRRRRHQAGDRPGDGQARHRRPGPGRHGGRRPRGVRSRAAVPAGLHRRRPHRARTGRRDRLGHRRRLRAGRLRAARRRDRRAPRADGARSLRHLGHRRRRRGGRRRAGPRPGQARRRDHRHGVHRPALQRLLAGAQGAAGDRPR